MQELFTQEEKFHASKCGSKKMYGDKSDAKRAARVLRDHGYPEQKPYRCPICKLYHLKTVGKKQTVERKKIAPRKKRKPTVRMAEEM